MMLKVLFFLGLILKISSVQTYGATLAVSPDTKLETTVTRKTEIILKIFEIPFEKKLKHSIAYYKDAETPSDKKLGLFDPNSNLIQEITDIPNELDQSNDVDIQIQSVEIVDINGDSKQDFILNVIQSTQTYDEVLNSYFFIKNDNGFSQLDVSFAKNSYKIQSPYIKVYSPLIQYKDPYFSQEDGNKWLDFYTFEAGKLSLSNHQKESLFTEKLIASQKKLKKLVTQIENHDPQLSQIETSQLALQEILEEILYRKILIKRIETLLKEIKKKS